MDSKTIEALEGLVRALKAFSKSVERSLHMGLYDGSGNTVVKQYRAMQAKAMQILPDDFYVQEVFTPEISDEDGDEQKCVQVRLVVSQMEDYIQGILKDAAEQRNWSEEDGEESIRGMSKQLEEQILNITRKTLKRAMSQIDFGPGSTGPGPMGPGWMGPPPTPPIPPIPPEPPEPPVPPTPPHRV